MTNIQTVITNRVAGQDITLADPYNNTNGLPDWWEILYFGSTTNTTGSAAPDTGASFTSKFEAGLHPVCVYNRWNHASGNLFDDEVIAIGSHTTNDVSNIW